MSGDQFGVSGCDSRSEPSCTVGAANGGFSWSLRPKSTFFTTVSDIVDAVKARQETAAGLPKAAFVVTMSKTCSRLSQQIEAALDEYGLPVLQARTTDRVA